MSTTTNNETKNKAKELFSTIIEDFISQLENGNNPFTFGRLQPTSAKTNKPYTNLNKMVLSYFTQKNGFQSAKWLTAKQIMAEGGKIIKGSKGTPIFFFSNSWAVKVIKNGSEDTMWSSKNTKDEAILEIQNKKGVSSIISASKRTTLKHFHVFNYDQTTLEDKDIITKPKQPSRLKVAVNKHISYEDGEPMRYNEDKDCIYGLFDEEPFDYPLYYKAVIESTKHQTRLDRNLEYAEEELVKLIGSSYLLGLSNLEQSKIAPDLASIFIDKLKTSPNSIWKYAREADSAYGMIINWVEDLGQVKGAA